MTRGKYFFYPKSDKKETAHDPHAAARVLPSEQSEEIAPPSFAFRAGNATLRRPLAESAERMATDILTELSSLQSRMASKKLAVPFASILALLTEFSEEYETVTAVMTPHRELCVATCTHNLLFAIGTVVLYAAANAVPIELIGGEDEQGPLIRLRTERSSLSPEEAAEHFGVSPYRMAVLRRIAEASDFSIEAIPADRSELCFRIPIYTPDTYRVFALTDPTLYQAFMQPLSYFVF